MFVDFPSVKMLNLVAVQTRNAAKLLVNTPAILARTLKTDLKVTWERPEKPITYGAERSGDIGVYEAPDPSNICLQYQYASELEE